MYNKKINVRKNKSKISKRCFSLLSFAILCLFIMVDSLHLPVSYAAFEEMITTGARSQGMGEAFVAISNDASALLINPAGLSFLDKMQLSTTYSMPYVGLENDNLMNSFLSFATPIMNFNAIGIGWNYFGAKKYNENVFAFSYSHKIFEKLSLAGTLKIMMWDSAASNFYLLGQVQEPEDLNGMGISGDLGVLYRPAEEVSAGLTITDINQPNIVSAEAAGRGIADLLPLGIRVGASFFLLDFLVDFDYIYKIYAQTGKIDSTICMGMERDLKSLVGVPIFLRGGVNFPGIVKGMNTSFGGSFKNTEGFMFQIDYAMILSFLESTLLTHRVSFTANFETFEERSKKAEEARQKVLEEERARMEEIAGQKLKEERNRQEEEEKKRKEIEEVVTEKLRKESEGKANLLAAEKAAREAEIEKLKLEAEKARLETEKIKLEAAMTRAEAEKSKLEAESKVDAEKKAREAAEAKVSELKGKLETLMQAMPKEVSMKETTRGLAVSLGSSVFFAAGKSVLSPTAYPLLDKIIEVVNAYPDNKISIEGHTDSKGKRDVNMRLSTERSENVARYFIEKGVAKERISIRGYGPDRPVASNVAPAGREQNRRVEVIILK